MKAVGTKNVMALPSLEKVVVSMGTGNAKDSQLVDQLASDLAKITGQKPVAARARKAVAGFKIQKGQSIGLLVTLRGRRMDDFLDRLINAVLPAMRDFKGISPKSVDGRGSLNLGFAEHSLFPEIGFEHIRETRGLQITVVPSAKNREKATALYKILGFPLKES